MRKRRVGENGSAGIIIHLLIGLAVTGRPGWNLFTVIIVILIAGAIHIIVVIFREWANGQIM